MKTRDPYVACVGASVVDRCDVRGKPVGLGALLPTLWPGANSAPLWTLPVVAALACFLGVFPLATMLGAAALSRLVLAIIDAPVDRTPILAALGGLSYGVATATALGRAYAARPEIT